MKTSYEIENDESLAGVVASDPQPEQAALDNKNPGYDIMDDIQKSSNNYITEYILIPLGIIAVVGILIFVYLKFIKKEAEAPKAEEEDIEKAPLAESEANAKPEEEEQATAEQPAAETTENVGKTDDNEEKQEEQAKEES